MDDNNDQDNPIEDDYYTFLNIPRDATPEEISNAYRRQSRLYHPDKHTDPTLKKEAEVLFNRTKMAYKVLSDPHRRAIYDSVGVRGLETEGWEIVQRTKTPEEIREEYERLAREREERRLQQHTNPKGSITVNINATDLFNKYDEDYEESKGILSCLEVSGMSFTQSIEAPLTLRDTVTMYGQLSTQNGTGTGSINVSTRRLVSSKGPCNATGQAHSRLSHVQSGNTKQYEHDDREGHVQILYRVDDSLRAGTFGVLLEYGAEKKVSRHSRLSAAVRVGVPTGVALRIKLRRASQSYTFSMQLSDDILPAPVFYATVVPIVTWTVVKKIVIDPVVKEREEREKEKQKEMNKSRMAEKQKEAKIATELMKATVSRIRAEEESKRGLIIVKALYGRFVYPQRSTSPPEEHLHRDEVIDVTIPLQCLVKNSKLVLHNASKSQLPGFYDPCVGEEKQLLVQYLFRTHTHECIIKDNAPLRIPLPSHKVNTT
ncbi:dnaJ homolog subfamily C member 11 isoform X2 [Halictus rubicundus]|uniref:dnaJ homolog subfamily C member 11 isoform X2 n=1 Tax=Halictus rubicundus TaxID=77578 RepID=UPI0040355DE4